MMTILNYNLLLSIAGTTLAGIRVFRDVEWGVGGTERMGM